jgi:virginiamycin A acetyltransferase
LAIVILLEGYTSISSDVKIGLIAHPTDFISTSPIFYAKRRGWVKNNLFQEDKKGFTKIGNDVLISANTMILAGVNIGNGAIIGAGSFVNKDVPPYAIVAGIPAKIIRYRFTENQIKKLEDLKWWNLTKEKLQKFENSFGHPDQFIKIVEQMNS